MATVKNKKAESNEGSKYFRVENLHPSKRLLALLKIVFQSVFNQKFRSGI